MDVKTDMNVVTTQMNSQIKEVQPPKQAAPQSTETGTKQTNKTSEDRITISAQGVEAQKNNENVKGVAAQTQKSQSLVDTII